LQFFYFSQFSRARETEGDQRNRLLASKLGKGARFRYVCNRAPTASGGGGGTLWTFFHVPASHFFSLPVQRNRMECVPGKPIFALFFDPIVIVFAELFSRTQGGPLHVMDLFSCPSKPFFQPPSTMQPCGMRSRKATFCAFLRFFLTPSFCRTFFQTPGGPPPRYGPFSMSQQAMFSASQHNATVWHVFPESHFLRFF